MENILDAIENIIEKYPEKIAISDCSIRLSFNDLHNISLNIIALLQKNKIKPGDTVAVSMPRSALLGLTLYSLIKYGTAYVFLDPSYPEKRIQHLINITKPNILLGEETNIDLINVPKKQSLNLKVLKRTNKPESYQPTYDTAYVMFTSGTTGKPKGIKIRHLRLAHYLFSLSERMAIDINDVYLHTAVFSFSSSVRQLFLPLINGASIFIASDKDIINPLRIADIILDNRVTIIDSSPSFWINSLDLIKARGKINFLAQSKVKTFAFSGDILNYELINSLRERCQYKGIIRNIYGLTETIGISTYKIEENTKEKAGIVPVGKVYRDVDYFIENDGQLNVAMLGLSDRYLNSQSDAFRQRIHNGKKKLFYQTGDVVRESDGLLYMLGRIDDQVKIHGRRVELSEIEAVLKGIDGVTNAVVVFNKRLTAFILIRRGHHNLCEKDLRKKSSYLLPPWMVPDRIMLLENFPKLPNMKIDRKAFQKADFYENTRIAFSDKFKKCEFSFYTHSKDNLSTEQEKKLHGIWQDILGHTAISVEDDFFQIGGASLTAIHLILEIKRIFKIDISVEQVYQHRSIRALSLMIANLEQNDLSNFEWAFIVHGGESHNGQILFWCGDFKPLWRLYLQRYKVYGFRSYYLPLSNLPCQPDTIEEFAEFYLSEIMSIQPKGPYYLGGYSAEGVIAYHIAGKLKDQGEKVFSFLLDPSKAVNLSFPSKWKGKSWFYADRGKFAGQSRHCANFSVENQPNGVESIKQLPKKILGVFPQKLQQIPGFINYGLFRKGLVRRMFFGGTVLFGQFRYHELLNKYSIDYNKSPVYLVQTQKFSSKAPWLDFLRDSCKKYLLVDSNHWNLVNDKKIIAQWSDELSKMMSEES